MRFIIVALALMAMFSTASAGTCGSPVPAKLEECQALTVEADCVGYKPNPISGKGPCTWKATAIVEPAVEPALPNVDASNQLDGPPEGVEIDGIREWKYIDQGYIAVTKSDYTYCPNDISINPRSEYRPLIEKGECENLLNQNIVEATRFTAEYSKDSKKGKYQKGDPIQSTSFSYGCSSQLAGGDIVLLYNVRNVEGKSSGYKGLSSAKKPLLSGSKKRTLYCRVEGLTWNEEDAEPIMNRLRSPQPEAAGTEEGDFVINQWDFYKELGFVALGSFSLAFICGLFVMYGAFKMWNKSNIDNMALQENWVSMDKESQLNRQSS